MSEKAIALTPNRIKNSKNIQTLKSRKIFEKKKAYITRQ